MAIKTGDVYKWESGNDTKYYFIEDDLTSIDHTLHGLHWSRIYFEKKGASEPEGYRTPLGNEYFTDLKKAVGDKLSEITDETEKSKLEQRFKDVPTHLKRHS
jgi:hypothetical protein